MKRLKSVEPYFSVVNDDIIYCNIKGKVKRNNNNCQTQILMIDKIYILVFIFARSKFVMLEVAAMLSAGAPVSQFLFLVISLIRRRKWF